MPKKHLHFVAAALYVAASAFAHAEPESAAIERCVAGRMIESPDPVATSEDAIRLSCVEELIRAEGELLAAEKRLGLDETTLLQGAAADLKRKNDAFDAERLARSKALGERVLQPPDERIYDPVIVAFVAGLILVLGVMAAFLFHKEQHLGWRRVSLLTGAVAFPAAVLLEFGNRWVSLMGLSEFYVPIALLLYVPTGMLFVLLARRLFLWLQDGFAKPG